MTLLDEGFAAEEFMSPPSYYAEIHSHRSGTANATMLDVGTREEATNQSIYLWFISM